MEIAMAAAGNGSLADLRDRALLLLGFGGASGVRYWVDSVAKVYLHR
jgi:hypothetical protein